MSLSSSSVMPGLVPGIHVFQTQSFQGVDGRNGRGHDECGNQGRAC